MTAERYRRPRTQSWLWRWGPRQAHLHVDRILRRYPFELDLLDYLRALQAHGARLRDREELPLRRFVELLEAPLREPTPPGEVPDARAPGYAAWARQLRSQIRDLEHLERTGALDRDPKWLFFCGADAPSGTRWYNFDVRSYLFAGERADTGRRRLFASTMTWDRCAAFARMAACYE